jgi:hypothetical protein
VNPGEQGVVPGFKERDFLRVRVRESALNKNGIDWVFRYKRAIPQRVRGRADIRPENKVWGHHAACDEQKREQDEPS